MLEAVIDRANDQAFWAWDEAEQDGVWFTEVVFKQWGFAERFMVTSGNWISF